MCCSSCKYLKIDDTKKGQVSGCCYYCTKCKKYINGSNDKCPSFEKSYRSRYECDKVYEDGKNYYDDTKSVEFYLIIFIMLLITLFIKTLLGI